MKRITTILLILLFTNPIIGQRVQEKQLDLESFKTHKAIRTIKKNKIYKKQNHYRFNTKKSEILRSTKADKKELDSLIEQEWDDGISRWVNSSKDEFTYDANENVNSWVNSEWDDSNSKWYPMIKFEFTFDSNRKLMVLLNYYWQIFTNQWALYSKNEYTYNSSGNRTLRTDFFWNTNTNGWDQSYKTEYTYDGNQNMILENGFEWFPSVSQWVNSYKDELAYDMSNNLILENNFYWNYGTNQWDHAYAKWEYTYDGSNNLISEILYDWDVNQWVNNDKYEYTYDSSGNLIVEIGSNWNLNTNLWDFEYKDEYTYDMNNNRTTANYYEWLSSPGEWSVYYKDEFFFDLAYTIIDDVIVPILDEDISGFDISDTVISFNNMVIGYQGFEYENQTWVNIDKLIFYYSNYNNPLNIDDEILAKSIRLYPNPVSDILVIDSETIPLKKVEIYSILGKKVKEIYSNFNSIPMNNLSSGVYIISVESEKGKASKKLLKI